MAWYALNTSLKGSTYSNVIDSSSSEQQRLTMTGTTDQIGIDIDKIKAMGVEHIIFGHIFSTIAKDMNKMIEIAKLSSVVK